MYPPSPPQNLTGRPGKGTRDASWNLPSPERRSTLGYEVELRTAAGALIPKDFETGTTHEFANLANGTK